MDTAFPSRFLVCIDDCFLTQHVREATHHRPGQAANTLDLVLSNEENMVEGVQHHAPLGKSHHDIKIHLQVLPPEEGDHEKTTQPKQG
jgi:hypothetical protein